MDSALIRSPELSHLPDFARGVRDAHGAASEKKTAPVQALGLLEIDPALTYFRAEHYHRPWLLDCRVRKGNGYFQPGMGTGRRLPTRATAVMPL